MSNKSRSSVTVRKFHGFLQNCLQRSILAYHLEPLTKPGDNYGSIVQSVIVKVAGKKDCDEVRWLLFVRQNISGDDEQANNCYYFQSETLHLVSKAMITNPYLVEMFQPTITFIKEANFYSIIIPALDHFQQVSNVPETKRIDAFIRYVGSRFSLDPSNNVEVNLTLHFISLNVWLNDCRFGLRWCGCNFVARKLYKISKLRKWRQANWLRFRNDPGNFESILFCVSAEHAWNNHT